MRTQWKRFAFFIALVLASVAFSWSEVGVVGPTSAAVIHSGDMGDPDEPTASSSGPETFYLGPAASRRIEPPSVKQTKMADNSLVGNGKAGAIVSTGPDVRTIRPSLGNLFVTFLKYYFIAGRR
ncbi:MAG: hypothetical protein QME66_10255 [Candidatus Eisenbacteria bacterium]|nr:hypothetical protein [Candidatus Eisenbacteria bacterium]